MYNSSALAASRHAAISALPKRMTGSRRAASQREQVDRQDVHQKAADLIAGAAALPKVLVLDLDYTLWPCWCECYSAGDAPPGLFPHVEGILDACRGAGIKLAVASRTPTPHVARAFMQKLGIADIWDSVQLIPAASGWDCSTAQKDRAHLPAIKEELGAGWAEMLFFDDEDGNVHKVSRLGVPSVLVDTGSGLSLERFRQGLELFAARGGDACAARCGA
ncbi:MAG: acid phosphatase-domain-containing protein [Monoraphidium minutum]|nr:MAG: acid phosphatase-domain-containing protein [Monoraphidium minutum]